MLALVLALAFAAQSYPFADANKQDIPMPYRGHWSLDRKYCNVPGPASVRIGARQVDFYERHGFLQLAQLNQATDPPTVYSQFRWAELGHFSEGGLRMGMRGSKLVLTENGDPDAPSNEASWFRCPK